MSRRLREHLDDLEALVGLTASASGIPRAYVEKDFWLTEVLRAATTPRGITLTSGESAEVTFVFKGGTSLSRIFGIIERFSEDVDLLAVFPPGASPGARHAALKAVDVDVTKYLGLDPSQVTVGPSTRGVKRYTTYRYPIRYQPEALREGVLLEMGSRGGSQPSTHRRLRSMVAAHAITALGEPAEAWEEFAEIGLEVLAPERTLLEKLAAVHGAVSSGSEKLAQIGRHYYDIFQILGHPPTIAALTALGPRGVARLADDIDAESLAADLPSVARPLDGYAASPAFDPDAQHYTAALHAYRRAEALLYGASVPLDDVFRRVQEFRHLL